MPCQDTKLESEGAEFLVLGQLLIAGRPACKAYTYTRARDLAVASPDAKRSATIQVKSRWATDANGFPGKTIDNDFLERVKPIAVMETTAIDIATRLRKSRNTMSSPPGWRRG